MKRLTISFIFILLSIFIGIFWLYRRQIPQNITEVRQQISDAVDTIAPRPTTILSSGLPNRHLLPPVFFVPQAPEKSWDQPWQDACEEAALLTVDYYYRGLSPDLPTILADYQHLFSLEKGNGWTHDVNLSQMATLSTRLGYQPTIIDNPTVDQIKAYLANNIPVIVPANGKILYTENKHFKNGGPWYHNLVIIGYDDPRSQFIVHDVGTQFGANFRYSYSLLMDSIHDFPSSGQKEDINSGIPRMLILIK